MSKKVYDAAVKVGTYEKDGETKGRYVDCGAVMKNDDGGFFMIMPKTFNPAGVPGNDGKESIIISLFEPKKKEGMGQ